MSVSAKITEKSGYTQVTLTTRVSTAIDMLFYADQLDTQQETQGVWDEFLSVLRDSLSLLDVRADFQVEYFKGASDVIFELQIIIQPEKTCPHDVTDERIAGTILSATFNHFDWVSYKKPRLQESFYSNKYKHLSVFQR